MKGVKGMVILRVICIILSKGLHLVVYALKLVETFCTQLFTAIKQLQIKSFGKVLHDTAYVSIGMNSLHTGRCERLGYWMLGIF